MADYPVILGYVASATPALVAGEKVLYSGRVPGPEQPARLIAVCV